jgi:Ser/Thr protein kinase RdoA (MazF antagonist)
MIGDLQPAVALARAALGRFDLPESAELTLARWGENITFRVDLPGGGRVALRLHRADYQSLPALRSEHAWTAALAKAGVPVPMVRTTSDGDSVPLVSVPGTSEGRRAAVFEWLEGRPLRGLRDADPVPTLRQIGALMARLHLHARAWTPPGRFVRPPWDAEALVGDRPRWGPFEAAADWDARVLRDLRQARELVRRDLREIGSGPDVYGLIHADLNPTNLLLGNGGLSILDFDDCGAGWFAYDAATVLQDVEVDEDFPALRDALLDGYRAEAGHPLPGSERLATFMMARRFARLGWVGSREATDDTRVVRDSAVPSTPPAVARFLDGAA